MFAIEVPEEAFQPQNGPQSKPMKRWGLDNIDNHTLMIVACRPRTSCRFFHKSASKILRRFRSTSPRIASIAPDLHATCRGDRHGSPSVRTYRTRVREIQDVGHRL